MHFSRTEVHCKCRKLSSYCLLNRLGTLQRLPYEIRQHIFMIVLVDSIDEHYKAVHRYDQAYVKYKYIDCDDLKSLELPFQRKGDFCFCTLSNRKPAFAGIFNLATYCGFRPKLKRGSLDVRLASHSIQAEFDCLFLTRSTFAFDCPTALRVFLDHLTPLEQAQLRRLKLSMFKSRYSCSSQRRYSQWLCECRTLPPKLTSLEFVMPYRLENIYQRWMYGCVRGDDATVGDIIEILRLFFMDVVRAVPQARISYSGHSVLETVKREDSSCGLALIVRDKFSQEERDVLDAMFREVESWRKFLCALLDA